MSERQSTKTEPAPQIQPQANRKATGTDTVTVACNLPSGVILQIYDTEEVSRFLPNGREIKENASTVNLAHGQWHVHGPVNVSSLAATGRDFEVDFRMVKGDLPDTGYALTPGIPRDFWERWLHDNERSPLITGRHIFSQSSENRAVSQAREFREFKSGFQGINQAGDYRIPNGKMVRKFDRNDNKTLPEEEIEEA